MTNESELPEVIAAGVPVVIPIAYEPDYRTDTIRCAASQFFASIRGAHPGCSASGS